MMMMLLMMMMMVTLFFKKGRSGLKARSIRPSSSIGPQQDEGVGVCRVPSKHLPKKSGPVTPTLHSLGKSTQPYTNWAKVPTASG